MGVWNSAVGGTQTLTVRGWITRGERERETERLKCKMRALCVQQITTAAQTHMTRLRFSCLQIFKCSQNMSIFCILYFALHELCFKMDSEQLCVITQATAKLFKEKVHFKRVQSFRLCISTLRNEVVYQPRLACPKQKMQPSAPLTTDWITSATVPEHTSAWEEKETWAHKPNCKLYVKYVWHKDT